MINGLIDTRNCYLHSALKSPKSLLYLFILIFEFSRQKLRKIKKIQMRQFWWFLNTVVQNDRWQSEWIEKIFFEYFYCWSLISGWLKCIFAFRHRHSRSWTDPCGMCWMAVVGFLSRLKHKVLHNLHSV